MSSFIVYNEEGRAQIMDRPLDMQLMETSIINPEDVYERQYSNGVGYEALHYDMPANGNVLKAYQPSKEARFANKSPRIMGYGRETSGALRYVHRITGNPMSVYYFAWDNFGSTKKEDYGIEVFNEDGKVTWASYQTSMDILEVVRYSDLRTAGPNLDDLYRKHFGHQNIVVIPVKMPRYLENNVIYDAAWCFDEAGALRIYRRAEYVLDSGEIAQNRYFYSKYVLEFIVADISNAQFFVNDYTLPRFSF